MRLTEPSYSDASSGLVGRLEGASGHAAGLTILSRVGFDSRRTYLSRAHDKGGPGIHRWFTDIEPSIT